MSRGKYDPKRFDVHAFLPQATKLARAELPDAKLVGFLVTGVTRDGRADITVDHGRAEITFSSPTGIDEGCQVVVLVEPKAIETYVEVGGLNCGRGVAMPRCSFVQVWQKMLAIGTSSQRATLSYNRNGWVFGGSDRHQSIDDDCP